MRFVPWLLLVACGGTTPADDLRRPAPPVAPSEESTPGSASSAPLPESDLGPEQQPPGAWTLPDGTAAARDAKGLHLGGGLVVPSALGTPSWSADGALVITAARGGLHGQLIACRRGEGWTCAPLVDGPGTPDRPAVSPDGARVAFAWAGPRGGWAGLWVMPTAGGPARRLTNTDVKLEKDGPTGFTALPDEGTLRWDGPGLRWTAQGVDGALAEVQP
jgi:hypothetical protein